MSNIKTSFYDDYKDLINDLPKQTATASVVKEQTTILDWGPSLADFQLIANKKMISHFGSLLMNENDPNSRISLLSAQMNSVHKSEYINTLLKANYGKEAPLSLVPSETSNLNLFTPMTKLMNRNIKDQDFSQFDFLIDNAFQAYRNDPIETFNTLGIDNEDLDFGDSEAAIKHSFSTISVLPNYKSSTHGYKEEEHETRIFYGIAPRNNFMEMNVTRGTVIKNPNAGKTYVHHLPYLVMTPSYPQLVFRTFVYDLMKDHIDRETPLKEVIENVLKYHVFDERYRKYIALAIEIAVISNIPQHPLKYILSDRLQFHAIAEKMLKSNASLESKYNFYENRDPELFNMVMKALATWFMPMNTKEEDMKYVTLNIHYDLFEEESYNRARNEYNSMILKDMKTETETEAEEEYTTEEQMVANR